MDIGGGETDMDNFADNKPVTDDFKLISSNKEISFIEVFIMRVGETTVFMISPFESPLKVDSKQLSLRSWRWLRWIRR